MEALAGILLGPVYKVICVTYNLIAKQISYIVKGEQRIQTLTTALTELKEKKEDVNRLVERAEMDGLTCTSQVKGWLQRVEAIENEASSILQGFRHQRSQNPGCRCCCVNCRSICKKSKRASKALRKIRELKDEGNFNNVVIDVLPSDEAVVEIPSRPTVGLEAMLETVGRYLEEDEVGIIGIYGMGGIGKTTLLMRINNGFLIRTHHFDVVIWVSVSKDFIAEKIQQAIGERLGLNWEAAERQEQRASRIYRVLRRKKFLLLLDDIWEGLDFEKIGIPFPDKLNKCKVIFTTRSKDVCSDMDADCKLKVEFLEEKGSWLLFANKVGGKEFLESDSIRPHAQRIVKKCGGLPLALITVGRAMANKETEAEWRNAIEVLNKSPSELRGMDDVFNLLKFSYDNLENDALKSCFLYCSLFPEDYSIEKEQLVEYWVGEGFLDSSYPRDVHDRGHDVIGSLEIACLLETGEQRTQVKMHDVVRSFALWIASDYGSETSKFLVQASMGLVEAPRVEDWEKSERVSLLDNGITKLLQIPKCPILSTLLLQWNSGLSRISNGFFQFMPKLRVLDLSFTSLREIPESIDRLVELHHLDLSGTKLVTLPKELGNLAKLKHLDLQRIHTLKVIPREAISGLSQLRVLNLYYSYSRWEVRNTGNTTETHEVGFSDLESMRHLATFGITVSELATLKRLIDFSSLLQCIQYLYIKECKGLFHLKLPSNSSNLKRLSINNCGDLEYLEISPASGKKWLKSLQILSLHGLPSLTTVWRNPVTEECLQNLCYVNIWHCDNLKNVSWVLHLPRLEVIYLFYCQEMEDVISMNDPEEGESKAFPSLRTLSIRDLPKLRSISSCPLSFPSLERLAVIDCPQLKKLPIKAETNSTLPTLYGTIEWWDGLEWEEDSTKSAFLPHFMVT
ncbi:disease resistance protein RPS2 [Ziziphus jujuba]|uniref:Disease resistance protein RPS2 n=1 Tax=Ziziphus jujuba TaxID=326968 RepID=A0A6P4A6Z9_ZIZJJ|nr:disease resistance protein RPS2 [Ziziphus jujuba]